MAIDPDIADQFKAAGVWRRYVELFEEYKDLGHTPREARSMAIAKVVAEAGITLRMPGDPGTPGVDNGEVELAPQTPSPASEKVRRKVFGDRKCTVPEAIMWVADCLEVEDVKAKDAPSAAAWSLLKFATRSPAGMLEFWSKMFSKLVPSRSALEERDEPFHDDGREILDTIEKLRSFSGKDKPRAA